MAAGRGDAHILPTVAVRTGDTAARDRARFQREPADILITTPESLYLLLTSNAREALRSVETVIVDEIHALVPTKRGAHLALSLERLEHLAGRRLQRIGLSATQRPLDEVARFLGGAAVSAAAASDASAGRTRPRPVSNAVRALERSGEPGRDGAEEELRTEFAAPALAPVWRPVTIVDAGARRSARAPHRGPGRGHGRASASRSRSPPGPRRRGRSAAPSGPPSTRGWWSWSASTAPR